ncbi:hypothetical protein MKX01_019559 [Papaver californicum]|nr:hypothetical protein MKX01_019559 [Papaver californicum]
MAGAGQIGVCYGTVADNLPSPQEVISLYKRNGIQMVRLFEPTPQILEALRGTGILDSVGTRNEDLAALPSSQDAANSWVATNIVPYKNDVSFCWVTAGNEVIPGPLSQFVPGAMTNLYNALLNIGLDQVKVTTVVLGSVLATSYPPSAGVFSPQVIGVMTQVSTFLQLHGAPLKINAYPSFAYASNPVDISLEYALFTSTTPVVDGTLNYYNLFDAMIGMSDVNIAVSESGWLSAGNEPYTSINNAKTYNTNLLNHVLKGGTPRRPDHNYDTFLFSMFNEDLKQPAGVEQNFGLYYPNMNPVYPLF